MNQGNAFEINDKNSLEQFVYSNWNRINKFIDEMADGLEVPIYSSCDIRESSTKYAPVDLNIYPAGFNNICNQDLEACGKQFRKVIEAYQEGCKKVFLIPESHTKNLYYLENIFFLKKAIEDAGYEVFLGSLDKELISEGKLDLKSINGHDLTIYPINKNIDGFLEISELGVTPCLAILNNDQSKPIDINWDELKTKVVPSPKIGWYQRQKNRHFNLYNDVVQKFSKEFSINPELIQANFLTVEDIDFSTKEGLEKLGQAVDELKLKIGEDKKIFIKASQGTYGMGIMVVENGDEVISMNRKKRNKMDIGKNNIKFTSVLVQEGIDTMVNFDGVPAEVTIYLAGGFSIGGFMRGNPLKSSSENLNSKGMIYQKFCISEIREKKDDKIKESVYSTIGRLSTIAGALEIKEFS